MLSKNVRQVIRYGKELKMLRVQERGDWPDL